MSNRINTCSIVRSPDYSYDAVASSYNTRYCCTTKAPGRKTYCKIYYISLYNAGIMTLQIVLAFIRALFSCEHLSNRLRISSLARHFGGIRSWNNCESPIRHSSNRQNTTTHLHVSGKKSMENENANCCKTRPTRSLGFAKQMGLPMMK